jgi:hypothetical protein
MSWISVRQTWQSIWSRWKGSRRSIASPQSNRSTACRHRSPQPWSGSPPIQSGVDGPKIVVLVTDGEETCGGNPQRAIRELVKQGIDVRVNIAGFTVDDEELKNQFEEWARIGGGRFFDAAGADELGEAIAAALQPPFEVRDSAGAVIGSGVVNGDAVRVPPSTYDVEIRSEPPRDFSDVVVGNGEVLVLSLADSG